MRAYTNQFDVSVDPISWLTFTISRIDPIWKWLGLGTPVAIIIGLFGFWRGRARKRAGNAV